MIEKMTEDLRIIQKLGTFPNTDDGLTADQLKAKFDQAGLKLQEYINEILVPPINDLGNRAVFLVGTAGNETVNRTVAEIAAAYETRKSIVLYDGGYLYALEGIGKDENGEFFFTFRCHDKEANLRVAKVSYPNVLDKWITQMDGSDLSVYSMLGRVGIIGDSLSVGVEDISPGKTEENRDHSWGAWLSRAAGNPCLHLGFSGATSATWIRDALDTALTESNRCDAYIIGLGYNDCHGYVGFGSMDDITGSDTYSDGSPYGSYYFNMEKILRRLHAFAPEAPIFVLTNPEIGSNAPMFNHALQQICTTYGSGCNAHLIDLAKGHKAEFEALEAFRGPNNHFPCHIYAHMGLLIGTAITRDILSNPDAYGALKGYLHRPTVEELAEQVIDHSQSIEENRDKLNTHDGLLEEHKASLDSMLESIVYMGHKLDDIEADCVQSPATASVGQILAVAAVDSENKPYSYKAVDIHGDNASTGTSVTYVEVHNRSFITHSAAQVMEMIETGSSLPVLLCNEDNDTLAYYYHRKNPDYGYVFQYIPTPDEVKELTVMFDGTLVGSSFTAGPGDSFMVTMTSTGDGTAESDRTFQQIQGAFQSGLDVKCVLDEYILPLCFITEAQAVFGGATGNMTIFVEQLPDNTVTSSASLLAVKDQVPTKEEFNELCSRVDNLPGGANQWKLINTITTTEDALNRVTCTTDSDGNAFSLTEVYVKAYLPASTTVSGSNFFYLNGGYFNGPSASSKDGYGSLYANGLFNQVSVSNGDYAQWYSHNNRDIPDAPYITKVELYGQSGSKNIPIGTTLQIFGR